MGEQAERVRRAADFLLRLGFGDVRAAFVLGSGLSEALPLERPVAVPFEEIPGFPTGGALGHPRRLEYGTCGGVPCLVARGRVHYYEGVDLPSVTFPVRVARALGARWIGLTSAVGALRPGFDVGDVVRVTDHLNLMGESPLAGPNDDDLGTRFPDLSSAYDAELAKSAEEAAREAGIALRRGVYAGVSGPQFETPAELAMLRTLGGDLVGMSLVPETIVAVHSKLRVLALSVVTDLAVSDAPALAHEDVVAAARAAAPKVGMVLASVLRRSS